MFIYPCIINVLKSAVPTRANSFPLFPWGRYQQQWTGLQVWLLQSGWKASVSSLSPKLLHFTDWQKPALVAVELPGSCWASRRVTLSVPRDDLSAQQHRPPTTRNLFQAHGDSLRCFLFLSLGVHLAVRPGPLWIISFWWTWNQLTRGLNGSQNPQMIQYAWCTQLAGGTEWRDLEIKTVP